MLADFPRTGRTLRHVRRWLSVLVEKRTVGLLEIFSMNHSPHHLARGCSGLSPCLAQTLPA